MDFLDNLKKAIKKNNSLLSIGIDPDLTKIPPHLQETKDWIFEFNKAIIDATQDLVCIYKPNIAFYSALGVYGLQSLQKTIDYIHRYTSIPVILDAKRGDIGNTSEKYAEEAFDVLEADAVTVNPFLGLDSLEPFLKRKEKGIIILCKTSNKSALDFQDLEIDGKPIYLHIAKKVVEWNKTYKNCLLVTGATWPEQLKEIRNIANDLFFLVPGIGTQGGDLENTLKYGLTKDKTGLIIHAGRTILYASSKKDFAEKAREEAMKLKESINHYR